MIDNSPTSYFDSYNTTFNKRVVIKDLINKVTHSEITRDSGRRLSVDNQKLGLLKDIRLVTADDVLVPILSHPLIYNPDSKYDRVIYIDVRGVSRIDKDNEILIIKDESAFNFIRWRANLTMYSLLKSKADIWDSANFTSGIYASWLSEALAKRFALDLSVSTKILVLAAVFYNVIFSGISVLATPESRRKLSIATTNRLGRLVQDASLVEGIIEQLSELDGLRDFTTIDSLAYAIRSLSDNVRLMHLSDKQILEATSYGWYGSDGIILCATAIEDPATFITLCVIGHENPNYHKTVIGTIVKRRASDMPKQIQGLVNEIKSIT